MTIIAKMFNLKREQFSLVENSSWRIYHSKIWSIQLQCIKRPDDMTKSKSASATALLLCRTTDLTSPYIWGNYPTYRQFPIPPTRGGCSGSHLEHFQRCALHSFSWSLVLLTSPYIHATSPPSRNVSILFHAPPSLTNIINLFPFFLLTVNWRCFQTEVHQLCSEL